MEDLYLPIHSSEISAALLCHLLRNLLRPQTIIIYVFLGFKCSDEAFQCTNGRCIRRRLVCDGDSLGCLDNSDEKHCKCLTTEFECLSGDKCVPSNNLCDGVDHCSDGSDETNCGEFTVTMQIR